MTQFRGKLPFERASEKWKDIWLHIRSKSLPTKLTLRVKDRLRGSVQWLHTYKIHVAGTIGAAALVAGVAYAGNAYVEANMNDVYEVYVGDEFVGEVSSPSVVEQLLVAKLAEVSEANPEVEWELEQTDIRFEKETVFMGQAEDEETVSELDALVEARAVGIEVVVNGKAVAIVKDEETAQWIMDRVMSAFAKAGDVPEGLTVLSANVSESRDDHVIAAGEPELQSMRIVEPVELVRREIQPNDVMDEQEVIDMLIQGDTKPAQYIVQEGDTPSEIAEKLNVSIEWLYAKNQDNRDLVERDLIRPGDVLDLTVLQPAVTIESVEKVTDTIEVPYDTVYEENSSMRKGQSKTLRQGENGVKSVTYLLTKVNGLLMDEQLVEESVITEPIPAVVQRGTKVVLGEGTGKFSWPVLAARLTSGFGKRWGRQHKGIDLVSSNKNILASDHGKVIFAGKKDDYGNMVIIDHQNGYETLYAHMSKITVKKGDVLEKGDKIGVMGKTGRVTGVHLHFEVIANGVQKNPMSYLRR